MSGDDTEFMPDLTATLALPLWAFGALAALIVVVVVFAIFRAGPASIFAALVRYAVILLAVVTAVAFVGRLGMQERGAERRALDARAMELTSRAVAAGSALACLDANAGETVATSCEKAIFASPATVAAGVAYVTAQLTLLADGIDYASRSDAGYMFSLTALQRAIEQDRFGFAAHALAIRDGCTADRCDALALLRDASRVRANLRDQTFQRYVGRNSASWSGDASTVSQSSQPDPPTQSAPVAGLRQPSAPSAVNIEFPSASSIPPVSIMNSEPPVPGSPPGQAAAPPPPPADPAAAAAAPRRPSPAPPPTARRPAQGPPQAAAPPVQLTPQPSDASTPPPAREQ
jgi:hypothetical protein